MPPLDLCDNLGPDLNFRRYSVNPFASLVSISSCASRAGIAQRRFLAKKSAGGGKKKGATPKKGPEAIKARGAKPAPIKAAGKKHGSVSGSSGVAAGVASAKPPTAAAAAAGGGGGGGGFTKSEMLAARAARKASLNEKSAAAAAAAAAVEAAETAVPAAVTAAGSKGRVAGGARAQGKWGWGAKFLAGTSAGLAVLGIAWQLKPDEVRRLLDDSPVDHFAIWLMGKYALVRGDLDSESFRFLCACFVSRSVCWLTVVRRSKSTPARVWLALETPGIARIFVCYEKQPGREYFVL